MNIRFLTSDVTVMWVSFILGSYQSTYRSSVMLAITAQYQMVREKSVYLHNDRADVAKR